jgi:hypothetical protein
MVADESTRDFIDAKAAKDVQNERDLRPLTMVKTRD